MEFDRIDGGDCIDAFHHLAILYADQGRLVEAKKIYHRVLDGKEKAYIDTQDRQHRSESREGNLALPEDEGGRLNDHVPRGQKPLLFKSSPSTHTFRYPREPTRLKVSSLHYLGEIRSQLKREQTIMLEREPVVTALRREKYIRVCAETDIYISSNHSRTI